MLATLGSSLTLRCILSAFALIVLVLVALVGPPHSPADVLRWAILSSGLFVWLLVALTGWSAYQAPWRWLLRKRPKLNVWIVPDLNGVWYGQTRSNWPILARLRSAAEGEGGLAPDALASTELQQDEIALEIKAHLFRLSIVAHTSAEEGKSGAISSRLERTRDPDGFRLSYVYRQRTPEPQSTDEDWHEGAASLEVGLTGTLTLNGDYWTRRKWREGMNTAGRITLTRVSERHAPPGTNLLEFAKSAQTPTSIPP